MSKPDSLVNRATTDNRDPTPGIVLQELVTKTQSIQDCRAVESLLLKKLEKNKPYIKYKALKVIKHLCEHGAPRWKQSWQSHTDKIRACTEFRGPPDAVYGDSPYENVRQAAKETMTAIFASPQIQNKTLNNRIVGQEGDATETYSENRGFASKAPPTTRAPVVSNFPSRTTPYNPTHISNTGFGNTGYKPKAIGTFQQQKQQPSNVNPNTFTTEYLHSQGKLNNQVSRSTTKRARGAIGGEWANEPTHQESRKDANHSDEERPQDDHRSRNEVQSESTNSRYSGRTTDGSFEQQWVNAITTAGGIGDKIPDLKQKIQQFQNLSQSHVLECLDEKLGDNTSWQSQAKALTLIEGLLNDISAPIVAEYFRASPEHLKSLTQSKKISLKKKSGAIANRIGLEIEPERDEREPVNYVVDDSHVQVKDDGSSFDNLFSTNPEQNENPNQDNSDIKTQDGIFDGLGINNNSDTYGDDELFTGLNVGANSKEKTIDSSTSTTINSTSSLGFLYDGMSFESNKTQPSTNFETLFQQMQNNTAPPVVNPPLRNLGGFNLPDPFASVTVNSQPTQSTPISKNKKEDKDPFAEFNLGTLGI